ncbi:MAG: STAS domain-containing protein [Phycisphaerales bacterium]|nr:STAS domain-containing protein [Phycisphaerales bacterium]
MPEQRSKLAGAAQTVLVVHLPTKLVDETTDPVREEVARRLPNADGAGVVLDCRDVQLMNSIGITCLLQVQDLCRKRRAAFVLAGVPAPIATFLHQLKLDRRFVSLPTVEEAIAHIDAGSRVG